MEITGGRSVVSPIQNISMKKNLNKHGQFQPNF